MTLEERIREFCAAKSISFARFGRLAMNDHRFCERLFRGCTIHHGTLGKIAKFMDDNPESDLKPKERSCYGKKVDFDPGPPIAEGNKLLDIGVRLGSQRLYKAILREHPEIVRNLTERRLRAA